jgi:CubicO group peptidase (beta-lactamase class C family)
MRSRVTWILGLMVAILVAGAWLSSGGHPRRMLAGIAGGPQAIAYLPPRRDVEVQPGPPQPTLTVEEAGMDPASLELAAEYAGKRNTRALVVGFNGHILYQKFWGETSLDSPVEASGFTPVLPALVFGTALQNGEIRNLDEVASKYLPEWADDPRGTITWKDLLTGNSNLAAPGVRPWPGSLAARYYVREGLGETLLAWPQSAKPEPAGSPFEVDADLLSLMLTRKFKATYTQLLNERIWQPLGAGSYAVGVDGESSSAGHVRAGCCLRARIGDWMRVGTLIANHGFFEGNQLLSPEFAQMLLTPTHAGSARTAFLRIDGQFAARDVVRLEAPGRQRLWMVPSLKLVILRVGDEPSASEGWDEAMIPDSIIRGTRDWRPASGGEGREADPKRYAPH